MRSYKLFSILVVVFVLLFSPVKVFASLYINEFSSGSSDSDWVEIYNSDSTSVDLSGYILRDSNSNKLDLAGTIGANSFVSFDWNSKLNNDGDTIRLLKVDESAVDQVSYGSSANVPAPSSSQTAGRQPDGTSNWVLFSSNTRNASNNSSSVVPTPTATPTNTPTPAPTNTPTPSPTPTPTPTHTPTPTPVKTTTPTPPIAKVSVDPNREGGPDSAQNASAVSSQQKQEVLGSGVNLGGKLDSLDNTKSEQGYNWTKLLILMGTVLVTGACGILVYNNYLKEKAEEI